MFRAPLTASLLALCAGLGSAHAQTQLYETGPAEDAAFVRFISALPETLTIQAAGDSHLVLAPESPSTPWQAVRANTPLSATLHYDDRSERVDVKVQPGEFVTVAGVRQDDSWSADVGRESPEDFSAFRVSIGLMNLAPDCSQASLRLAGSDVEIVAGVNHGDVHRRQINPVSLSAELFCDASPTGAETVLDSLRAGDRWTLVVHQGPAGPAILPVLDRMP